MDISPQQAKKLQKVAQFLDNNQLASAESFIELEEKVDTFAEKVDEKLNTLSEELKKKLDEELVYEVDESKIVKNVLSQIEIPIPKDGEDGKDGKNYILTDKDRKEIAKSIDVPVIEKIIEKTEVIKEQPIVTEVVKEVAVTDPAEDIRNKLELLEGDERLKREAIRGLDDYEEISKLAREPKTIKNYASGGAKVFSNLLDVPSSYADQAGKVVKVKTTEDGLEFGVATDTDEKVKYNASDTSAGYLADKVVAGTGITLTEGTGADADKLKITNSLDISGKLDKNTPITGATKTKITYDADGLVTAGADATTADIADSTDKRYVSDADLTNLSNLSGTNTGDQDLSGLVPYYDVPTQSVSAIKKIGSNFGTDYVDFELGQIWNGGALIFDWNYTGNGYVKMPYGWEVTDGFSFLSGVNSAGEFYASSVRADNSFNLANLIDNSFGPISIHSDVFMDYGFSSDGGAIYTDGAGTLTVSGLSVSSSVTITDAYLNNIFETVGSTQVMDAPSRTLWSSSGQPENAVLDWSEDGKVKILGELEVYDVTSLGSELVTNPSFTAAGTWTYGTGWSRDAVNNEADHTGNNAGVLSQTITGLKANTLYKVEYTVKNWTQGWIDFTLGGGEVYTGLNANRTHSFIYRSGSANQTLSLTMDTQGGSGILSIDDVSVKEIIGGDAYVANDLQVNGDIKGSGTLRYNDFIYGSMYANNITQSVTVSATDTHYEVGGGMTGGTENGMTFQNSKEIKVLTAGKYKVDYSLSAQTAAANQEIETSVMINSTAQVNTSSHAEQMTANRPNVFAGTGILTLAVNDVVKLCVANHTATNNIVVAHANMTLMRIDD